MHFLMKRYIFGKAGSGFERINLAVPTRYIEAVLERIYNAIKKNIQNFVNKLLRIIVRFNIKSYKDKNIFIF